MPNLPRPQELHFDDKECFMYDLDYYFDYYFIIIIYRCPSIDVTEILQYVSNLHVGLSCVKSLSFDSSNKHGRINISL